MYDNKVRLSQDVLQKAELIAAEWGLKNARAAVEAVFRRYSDEYLHGRQGSVEEKPASPTSSNIISESIISENPITPLEAAEFINLSVGCEALNELDDLLGM